MARVTRRCFKSWEISMVSVKSDFSLSSARRLKIAGNLYSVSFQRLIGCRLVSAVGRVKVM